MLKQEFSEFRIGEAEGLHKGHDRMQKILSQLNQLKAKPEDEDINLKFLRALPSSWSQMSKDTLLFPQPNLQFQAIMHLLEPPVLAKRCHMEIVQVILQLLPTLLHQTLRLSLIDLIEKLDLEEIDLNWQMVMLSVRVHKFEQKAGRKIDFDKNEYARFNKKKVRCYKYQQRGHFARECRANRGNDKQRYSSFKIKEIRKKEEDSKALITVDTLVDWTYHDGESNEVIASKEFGMIAGCDTEDAVEEGAAKIYSLITGADTKEASTAGDARDLAFMGVTSEVDLSDHIDLDESQMSYGTKSSTSSNSKSVSNDFVSCDDSDKSSEVITNDFAFSDSNVKSSEPKPYDSTSCALTSSDLAIFFCNSSDKNENTSRTFCNKNGYFNKKAGHFRKNALFVSKLCFVCGSGTHLIKDCDFYKTQMVNKTIDIGVGPVHSRNKVNHQNQFVPQAILLRTCKVNIPPARPHPVPTGKPKVLAPVPTSRQNRPFPVPTDRGDSPSVISGWWKSTARPMPYFTRPTSSYFQPYTPYVPTMYYNYMKYGGNRWATTVKPLARCSRKSHRKGLYWENPFPDAEDEGVFDSGCSRSMTGNKERLDDFKKFQGGKVTFGGSEGRITGKGTIRTPTLDFKNVYYEFKLPDKSMVVLRVPRKHNVRVNIFLYLVKCRSLEDGRSYKEI
nr:ribonuclease H-like domain-containing protein [Tanacetum cinerariifolium]